MDIISTALKYSMFTNGDKVLVAVSGGPDSIALLHALFTNKETLGISSLHIAHINHGIRGIESDLDEKFVFDIANEYKIPLTRVKVSVPEYMRDNKLGMEEAARKLRHDFLRKTAIDVGANKIALGHNSDDRVESVLINIIRGTGINGLGSIRPKREIICRPLIETSRKEIIDYISKNNLKYRIDMSNENTAYTRNKIRHDLLPCLETDYNPNIRSALIKLSQIEGSQTNFIKTFTSDV